MAKSFKTGFNATHRQLCHRTRRWVPCVTRMAVAILGALICAHVHAEQIFDVSQSLHDQADGASRLLDNSMPQVVLRIVVSGQFEKKFENVPILASIDNIGAVATADALPVVGGDSHGNDSYPSLYAHPATWSGDELVQEPDYVTFRFVDTNENSRADTWTLEFGAGRETRSALC